jgi:hypothetical protein
MNVHDPRRVLRALLLLLLVLGAAPGVDAGLFRAYLSFNGLDSNPCTVDQPCRLLPAALAAVNDGGEIWMQNSGNFNTGKVTITKSVTILAVPGALASVVANAEDAIYINTPGVTVTLRNLNLVKLAGSYYGVRMMQGSALTVEGCEFYGHDTGIHVEASAGVTNVSVRDTVIRNGTFAGVLIWGGVRATFDRVHFLSTARGILIDNGATATIGNSVITNNSVYGLFAYASSLVLANSIVNGNTVGVWAQCLTGCSTYMTLQHNAIAGNVTGVLAESVGGSSVIVTLDDNAITRNGTGIQFAVPALVYTRSNNTIELNTSDVTGPAMTVRAGR